MSTYETIPTQVEAFQSSPARKPPSSAALNVNQPTFPGARPLSNTRVEPGEYLLVHDDGSVSVMPATTFASTFRPVQQSVDVAKA